MKFDRCEYCQGVVRERKATVDLRRGKKLFIFYNASVGVCSRCGERYYPGPVLEQLTELAEHGLSQTKTIKVPAFDLAKAAM